MKRVLEFSMRNLFTPVSERDKNTHYRFLPGRYEEHLADIVSLITADFDEVQDFIITPLKLYIICDNGYDEHGLLEEYLSCAFEDAIPEIVAKHGIALRSYDWDVVEEHRHTGMISNW